MKTILPRSLRVAVLLTIASASQLWGTEPAKPPEEEKIELPKFTVKGLAVCSYGIAVAGIREPDTKKIKRLFVTDVSEDSIAQHQGLQEGDEILSINGTKVAGMDGTMKPGCPLFDLLINQPPGQSIKLEVVVRSTKNVTLKAGQ